MKQFVKALDLNGEFKHIQNKFIKLSVAKVKQGIFVRPYTLEVNGR